MSLIDDPPEPIDPLQVELLLSRVRCVAFAALGGGADAVQVLAALEVAIAAQGRRESAERTERRLRLVRGLR